MATVRELVAKLGFDYDSSGADDFQKQLKGIKQGLGALFTTKVLKGATSLEDSFLESQRKIEFLAGKQGLIALDEALKNTSETASKVDIAESIRRGLEVTTDPEFVSRMAKFGGLMADAFGGTMQDRTQELIEGAFSGDFSSLVSAGLFTQQEAEFLKGANINTVQGKLTIINKLEQKRNALMIAREKSMKTASTQTARFFKNFENFAKLMGSFISPIVAKFLGGINDVFEFLLGSPMAGAIAKITAFGLGLLSVVSSLKFIGFALKKVGVSIAPILGVVARMAGWFVSLVLLANDFFKLMTGANLLKPFEVILKAIPQVLEAFEKMGAFFGSKIGAKFNLALEGISGLFGGGEEGGGLKPPTNAESKAGAGVVDNRKAEIVINAQGANAKEVEDGVVAGLTRFSFGQELTKTRQEFVTRNTENLGANAQ